MTAVPGRFQVAGDAAPAAPPREMNAGKNAVARERKCLLLDLKSGWLFSPNSHTGEAS